jgi:glutaminyl-tRNA synthetase
MIFIVCFLNHDKHRPVEESLSEFENMKKGKYAANEATLRMKMDMFSPNPNMWDQVIFVFLTFILLNQ